jgi:hypothetical protein
MRSLISLTHALATSEDRSEETRLSMGQNNITRAERAKQVLVQKLDEYPGGEDADTVILDHLADIMHLCRQNGLDFEDLLRRGRNHHGDEAAGVY